MQLKRTLRSSGVGAGDAAASLANILGKFGQNLGQLGKFR